MILTGPRRSDWRSRLARFWCAGQSQSTITFDLQARIFVPEHKDDDDDRGQAERDRKARSEDDQRDGRQWTHVTFFRCGKTDRTLLKNMTNVPLNNGRRTSSLAHNRVG